jgi:tryptophan synthase alpha chain
VSSALESAAQATRPALLMTYYNPLLSRGLERFAADASAAGVAGVIVPDLPPEEGEELHRRLREQGLGMSYLIAPTSSPERIEIACRASDLFIYVVSLMGTTGARSALSERVAPLLAEARRHTSLPLVVGFGISGPEQVEGLRGIADGFIVGSALVDRVGAAGANAAAAVEAFVTELREAC